MRLLFTLLVSILFATTTWADKETYYLELGGNNNIDLAHWVSKMPDDMRLCQMSIPRAHDAGTHSINSSTDPLSYTWYQDQYYDEGTLFRKGVRAFDLRFTDYNLTLTPYEAVEDMLIDTGGGFMCHGDHLWMFLLRDRMNTFLEEMKCMPTAKELDGEFMILNLSVEYTRDKDKTAAKRKLIGSFVKLLIERYGADRFIKYNSNLTKKELSGKILLFVGQRWEALDTFAGYSEGIEEVNYYERYFNEVLKEQGKEGTHIPFNISYHDDNDTERYPVENLTYKDKKNTFSASEIVNFPGDKALNEGDAKPAGNSFGLGYVEDNREPDEVTDFFKQGLSRFHNRIDDLNTQNLFYSSGIEGYARAALGSAGGSYTANDREYLFGVHEELGANHLTYDYIKGVQKPLGMVNFDFCGAVQKDDDQHLLVISKAKYGDLLLKEIVRHNFMQKNLVENFTRGFISDIVLCCVDRTRPESNKTKEEDGLKAKRALEAQGYQLIMDYTTDDLLGPYLDGVAAHRIYFGAKYTSNPDSAVHRLHLIRTYSKYLEDYHAFHDDALKVKDFEAWDYGWQNLGKNKGTKLDSLAWEDKYNHAFWGSRYAKPLKVIDLTEKGANKWGSLRAGLAIDLASNEKNDDDDGITSNSVGSPWHAFLWQVKTPIHDDDNGAYGLLFDFTKNYTDNGRYIEDVKWMEFQGLTAEDTHGWDNTTFFNITNDDKHVHAFNKTLLTMKRHFHNTFAEGYDENMHFDYCTLCNYKVRRQEHVHKYEADELGYVHIDWCTVDKCGFKVSRYCADYCKDFDTEGFGTCDKCEQVTYQPAVKNAKGVFEISNPGQFCWFSRYVAYGHPDADAILMSDISTTRGGFMPIGFATDDDYANFTSTESKYEKELKDVNGEDSGITYRQLTLLGVGYSGTFDGNGHTVFYNYNHDKGSVITPTTNFEKMRCVDGMFTFVNGGTVKNLGIADDSQILSNKPICGSVAGLAYKANFENIYSKATIITGDGAGNGHVSSGLVGIMSASTLKNGYFAGKIPLFWKGEDPQKHLRAASAVCVTTEQAAQQLYNFLQPSTVSNFYYDKTPVEDFEWDGVKIRSMEMESPEEFPGVRMMNHKDFTDGKVCYLLNSNDNNDKNVWFQKIKTGEKDTDGNYYPMLRDTLGNNTNIVYGGYKHGGNEIIVTNNKSDILATYKHINAYNAEAKSEADGNHDFSYKLSEDYPVWRIDENDKPFAKWNFKCEVCNDEQTLEDEASSDENQTDSEPTCTKEGHRYVTCTHEFNENVSFTDTHDFKTDPLGHDFSDKKLSDEPKHYDALNYDLSGDLYSYVCSRDGALSDIKVIKDYSSEGNLELSRKNYVWSTSTDIHLTDDNQFKGISFADISTPNYPTYTRTMKNQWGTFCAPFGFEIDESQPYEFYYITSITDNTLTLKKATNAKHTNRFFCLIRVNREEVDGKEYRLVLTSNEKRININPYVTSDNLLDGLYRIGCFEKKDITDEKGYIIANNKFWNIQDLAYDEDGNRRTTADGKAVSVTCLPFHGYLGADKPSDAKVLNFSFSDDESSAIETINALTSGEAEYYDMNGRRISDLQHGVNIVKYGNGVTKKVILK